MSDEQRAGAAKTLRKIRGEKFSNVPKSLLDKVFDLETEAQFETERGAIVAKLRDLIAAEAKAK